MSDKKFITYTRKTVGKGINRYNMISNNDRVAVALSGGKDSLVLLETLSERRKYIPISYDISAIHVMLKSVQYEIDNNFIQKFCDQLSVPLYFEWIDVDLENIEKSPCFICSWNRRKILFNKTAELNCNKLAFGHHLDDAIETLFLNMVYHGQMSSIPPKLSMFNGEFELIRPLIFLTEKETSQYAKIRNFNKLKKECPIQNETKRNSMKQIVQMFEKLTHRAKVNIYKSLYHINKEYLPPHG